MGGGVWVIPASGGEARNIAPRGAFPDWSRDGTSILFGSFDGPLSINSPDGTTVEEVLSVVNGMARWSLDGTFIYYFPPELDDIWSFRLADGSTKPMTELRGRPGQLGDLGLATDGEYLYFTWRQDVGDIWVMDVVTDEDE